MDSKYAGMTVNERLYASNLMADFDEAVKKKNTEMARTILQKTGLNEASIRPILEKLELPL